MRLSYLRESGGLSHETEDKGRNRGIYLGVVGMSDDIDYKTEKNNEMLMDYQRERAEEEIQANCHHENIYIEEIQIVLPMPKDMKKGEVLVTPYYRVEAYFVCYDCNKAKWVPVDMDDYIVNLNDPEISFLNSEVLDD
tara:strand:- start:14747 stop:15160 length:414 start_codon:yes stop_codon:yes gene_type:complete